MLGQRQRVAMTSFRRALVAGMAVMIASPPALGNPIRKKGTSGDWSVRTKDSMGRTLIPVCFLPLSQDQRNRLELCGTSRKESCVGRSAAEQDEGERRLWRFVRDAIIGDPNGLARNTRCATASGAPIAEGCRVWPQTAGVCYQDFLACDPAASFTGMKVSFQDSGNPSSSLPVGDHVTSAASISLTYDPRSVPPPRSNHPEDPPRYDACVPSTVLGQGRHESGHVLGFCHSGDNATLWNQDLPANQRFWLAWCLNNVSEFKSGSAFRKTPAEWMADRDRCLAGAKLRCGPGGEFVSSGCADPALYQWMPTDPMSNLGNCGVGGNFSPCEEQLGKYLYGRRKLAIPTGHTKSDILSPANLGKKCNEPGLLFRTLELTLQDPNRPSDTNATTKLTVEGPNPTLWEEWEAMEWMDADANGIIEQADFDNFDALAAAVVPACDVAKSWPSDDVSQVATPCATYPGTGGTGGTGGQGGQGGQGGAGGSGGTGGKRSKAGCGCSLTDHRLRLSLLPLLVSAAFAISMRRRPPRRTSPNTSV